ncbi:MAG: EAL domain-containing protein [Rhizobiales bacterium]|nr:EAL domain-containing protein [Hyphomicrobiales bacterium]
MARLTAIFIAICVIVIAASVGAVAYLFFGLSGAESAIVALAVTTALALYNTVAARLHDRGVVGDQIADLSRGTADLARQVGELGRKVAAFESQAAKVPARAGKTADPLAREIEELGNLVTQLAEAVAAHDAVLKDGGRSAEMPIETTATEPIAVSAPESEIAAPALPETPAAGPFKGLDRDAIVAILRAAIDANRVDLYLQPIVTLPQRKVRFYEALTRLRTEDGTLLLPEDYLAHAEVAGLLPKIDNLLLFRSVQVLRRLHVKNRDVGLFCNIAIQTLNDTEIFPQVLQFLEANRVLATSLVLEFTHDVWRSMGLIEAEGLESIAGYGFRFAMDRVIDLRLEPRDLSERGIRYIKVPQALLTGQPGAGSDIHAADLSDLLGRFGISLIAGQVEKEATVVDLLDYDVRFAQGLLFSPPRPVRADALQGVGERPSSTGAAPPAAARDTSAGDEPLTPSAERASALAKIARQAGRV